MGIDIEKLNDKELDSLQKKLDERARKRELAKHPLRGFRSGRPVLPPDVRIHHRTAFEIDAVKNRTKDACGELEIEAQRDNDQEFTRKLEHLLKTIDSEVGRGFDEEWGNLNEEGRQILVDAIYGVQQTLQMMRRKLTSRRTRIDLMVKVLSEIELPKPPLSHRAGEAIGDTVDQVSHAAGAIGKGLSKAAQSAKSLLA